MSSPLSFQFNGTEVEVTADPMARLLDVVREDLGATGTKEGCGEGECGSCSVLLDGEVVCSCLVPIVQCVGREVRTIESSEIDATLATFVEAGGVQCGACTPGIVLTLRALLERNPHPDRAVLRDALAGNLCRCTGYERILRAVEEATR